VEFLDVFDGGNLADRNEVDLITKHISNFTNNPTSRLLIVRNFMDIIDTDHQGIARPVCGQVLQFVEITNTVVDRGPARESEGASRGAGHLIGFRISFYSSATRDMQEVTLYIWDIVMDANGGSLRWCTLGAGLNVLQEFGFANAGFTRDVDVSPVVDNLADGTLELFVPKPEPFNRATNRARL